MSQPYMLEIQELESGYGKKQILYGLSLNVLEGEIVSIIGSNGSGKSTILKAVYGQARIWSGQIVFDGQIMAAGNYQKVFSRTITFCPQGKQVFSDLTIRENLEIGGIRLSVKDTKDRIDEVLEEFPLFKDRLDREAGNLSGGQQQLLSIAKSLIPKPKLLMLDEPSLGLSPKMFGIVFDKLIEINQNNNITIIIVEQRVKEALDICHKVYAIRQGTIAFEGLPIYLKEDHQKLKDIFL